MKPLSPEATARLEGRRPIIAGAARLSCVEATYRLWSGYGQLPGAAVDDSVAYEGIGDIALITPHSSQLGGAADALTITLSGLDPDVAAAVEQGGYHQRPITIFRVIFAANGHEAVGYLTMLRGRVDFITQRETVGGEAALDVQVEGPRIDINRALARIASNVDQRLIDPDDGCLRHAATSAVKTMKWGQHMVTGAQAFNSGLLGKRSVARALGFNV